MKRQARNSGDLCFFKQGFYCVALIIFMSLSSKSQTGADPPETKEGPKVTISDKQIKRKQKVIILPDKSITGSTVLTSKEVQYKQKEKVFKPVYYTYIENGVTYFNELRKIRYIIYHRAGKPNSKFLDFLGGISIMFGDGQNYTFYKPFYGLKSATDSSIILPTEYSSIQHIGKDVYIIKRHGNTQVYFRELNKFVNAKQVQFDWGKQKIMIERNDSTCLLDYSSKTCIAMMRGSLYLLSNGAVWGNGYWTQFLDSAYNFVPVFSYSSVADRFKSEFFGVNYSSHVPQLEWEKQTKNGAVIKESSKLVIPFSDSLSFAIDRNGLWEVAGTAELTGSGFRYTNISFYHNDKEVKLIHRITDYSRDFVTLHNKRKTALGNLSGEKHPVAATDSEGITFFDSKGKILSPVHFQEIKYQWFNSLNVAVIGEKDPSGKTLYSIVDKNIRLICPTRFLSVEISNPNVLPDQEAVTVQTTDINGELKIRSFKAWLLELSRN